MKAPFTGAFRSLRGFNYRVWAAGASVSNVGTWVQRTAQDWLVFTQLTQHDASAVGLVMALQFGPQLLLLPWTGFAADHFNQRKLLIATQATMGGLALVLGLRTVAGLVQLWHVYIFAFLFGSAAAFDAPRFHEAVLTLDRPAAPVLAALAAHGIAGGLDLGASFPELGQSLLVCATETKTDADIDSYARALGAAMHAPHATTQNEARGGRGAAHA